MLNVECSRLSTWRWAIPAGHLLAALCLAMVPSLNAAEVIEADLCIYGGTAGGVAAGVQAARMGKTAVIVEFGNHLGGLTSGGLGATDIGNKAAIGGIAREFYHRVWKHYDRADAWKWQKREAYGNLQPFFARQDRFNIHLFRGIRT